MKYLMSDPAAQSELLDTLAQMPDYLSTSFAGVSAAAASTRGPGDVFSPVEQCWHLADLEREAFAVRIRRLLSEPDPRLADFDAWKNGKIVNNDARRIEGGGNDYWESGLQHPEGLLADLVRALHPELLPKHELVWYRFLP